MVPTFPRPVRADMIIGKDTRGRFSPLSSPPSPAVAPALSPASCGRPLCFPPRASAAKPAASNPAKPMSRSPLILVTVSVRRCATFNSGGRACGGSARQARASRKASSHTRLPQRGFAVRDGVHAKACLLQQNSRESTMLGSSSATRMDALTTLPHTPEDRGYHTRTIERITSGTLTQINSGMAQRRKPNSSLTPTRRAKPSGLRIRRGEQ